jgi:hypothetical protein
MSSRWIDALVFGRQSPFVSMTTNSRHACVSSNLARGIVTTVLISSPWRISRSCVSSRSSATCRHLLAYHSPDEYEQQGMAIVCEREMAGTGCLIGYAKTSKSYARRLCRAPVRWRQLHEQPTHFEIGINTKIARTRRGCPQRCSGHLLSLSSLGFRWVRFSSQKSHNVFIICIILYKFAHGMNARMEASMMCLRIYCTADGESHFDEVAIATSSHQFHPTPWGSKGRRVMRRRAFV